MPGRIGVGPCRWYPVRRVNSQSHTTQKFARIAVHLWRIGPHSFCPFWWSLSFYLQFMESIDGFSNGKTNGRRLSWARRPRHSASARCPHHAGFGPRRHGPRSHSPCPELAQRRRLGDGRSHRPLTEPPVLVAAIEAHRAYVAAETLVSEWSTKPLGGGAFHAEVKVDGQGMVIELRKN